MRKFAGLAVVFALLISLAACGSPNSDPSPEIDESPEASTAPSVVPEQSADPRLELIEIETGLDEAMGQVIVTVKNGSDSTLTCFVQINVKSDNKSIKRDTMLVDAVPAGQTTFARIDIDTTESITVETEITKPEFSEATDTTGGEYNEAASIELWEKFSGSFGIPELDIEWFQYVDGVSVYDADPGYIIVTVNGGATGDIERIGNTVFGNYVYNSEDGLGLVVVHDADGEELWRREV